MLSLEMNDLKYSLKCCGFDEKGLKCYMKSAESANIAEQIRLLNMQRKKLMDNLHTLQKQIDTIDFLIYSLKKM